MSSKDNDCFCDGPCKCDCDECDPCNDENVTTTFDRTPKYYRVLRPETIEHKYRSGLNSNDGTRNENQLYWSLVADEDEGGFYFTDISGVLEYTYCWGDRICEVTVPDSATIYKEHEGFHDGSVWRASEIVLSEPKPITKDVLMRIVNGGGTLTIDNIQNMLWTMEGDKYTSRYESKLTKDDIDDIINYLKKMYQEIDK